MSTDLSIPGFALSPIGLQVDGNPTFDQWEAAGQFLQRIESGSTWWVGDLANLADQWGDEYVQLLDGLNIEYEALRKYAAVSKAVDFGIRIPNLTWTHHRIVSSLTPSEQKKWLKKSQPKEGETKPRLSVADLKEAVREDRLERLRKENPLPSGSYRVLYADPPWKYEHNEADNRAIEWHYPTMELAEICPCPFRN